MTSALNILDALRCGARCCACLRAAPGRGNVHCPAHHDEHPSLSVAQDGDRVLVNCHAGCPQDAVIAALRQRELWGKPTDSPPAGRRIAAAYDYRDAAGVLRYQVLRYIPKEFSQRRPDIAGGWVHNLQGVQPLPYRLPELIAADPAATVYIAEGEKDVDRLRSLGLVATTNSGGAGKWRAEFAHHLAGRHVVVLPDNDHAGRQHAAQVASSLAPLAASVKVVELPGLPEQGDPSDWLDAGHTAADLDTLVVAAAEWDTQSGVPTLRDRVVVGTFGIDTVSAVQLRAEALDPRRPRLHSLPLLGVEGFIFEGLTHLVSAPPKAGKTTLLMSTAASWDLPVRFITEEPRQVWRERLAALPPLDNITVSFALGADGAAISELVSAAPEAVVVLDTLKLLRLVDENDNAQINRALTPIIAASRAAQKTLVLLHHVRKGSGEGGEAAAGGHAFLSIVDIALEVLRDPEKNRRKLRGWGRVFDIPELLYERVDGTLRALGNPAAVSSSVVKERIRGLLSAEWQTTDEVLTAMAEPKPAKETVRKELLALATEGNAERDPPMDSESTRGARHRWRLPAKFQPPTVS